ncbi:Mariner Mos1 transposase [Eumeta japonica]|uniref:Mariner Mos1 transposase n=1 Tax=Eumeta variegata TaxID=151549 RepID=A0A4C1XHD7_EUMVA|nr:Mariner Mos1 transposase [Eumeta japonica]
MFFGHAFRLCSDVSESAEDTGNGHVGEDNTDSRVQGVRLRLQQYTELLKRQFLYTKSKIYVYAIFNVLVPLVCIAAWTALLAHETRSSVGDSNGGDAVLSLRLYEELGQPVVLYGGEEAALALEELVEKWPYARLQLTDNVTREVLETRRVGGDAYGHFILGVQLNATTAHVHYSTAVRHAAPVALAVLADALAARVRPPAGITTMAAPLQPHAAVKTRGAVVTDAKPLVALYSWALFFMLADPVKNYLKTLNWEVLPHPPYSPDIAPSDYHLLRSMAHALSEQRFTSYEDTKNWVNSWIASKDKEFFRLGIRTLPERWKKVVASDGQYFN